MDWHGRAGVAIIGLLTFRMIWGFVGSTHARFSKFVRGPAAIAQYLQGSWQGVGHNPLGALSVLGMLALLSVQAVGGLFANDDIAFNGPYFAAVSKHLSDWVTGWHKRGSWLVLGLLAMHLAAILFYTHVRKESLIKPMLSGTKEVPEALGSESARGGGISAFIVAIVVGLSTAWVASGALLPTPPEPTVDASPTAQSAAPTVPTGKPAGSATW